MGLKSPPNIYSFRIRSVLRSSKKKIEKRKFFVQNYLVSVSSSYDRINIFPSIFTISRLSPSYRHIPASTFLLRSHSHTYKESNSKVRFQLNSFRITYYTAFDVQICKSYFLYSRECLSVLPLCLVVYFAKKYPQNDHMRF